jgi:hypothetical protein
MIHVVEGTFNIFNRSLPELYQKERSKQRPLSFHIEHPGTVSYHLNLKTSRSREFRLNLDRRNNVRL